MRYCLLQGPKNVKIAEIAVWLADWAGENAELLTEVVGCHNSGQIRDTG